MPNFTSQFILKDLKRAVVNLSYKNIWGRFQVDFQHVQIETHRGNLIVYARGKILNPPFWGSKKARAHWYQNTRTGEWFPTSSVYGTPDWVKEFANSHLQSERETRKIAKQLHMMRKSGRI